ncbi:MAG: hypothetical protein Q9211_004056 [Gyalolechia sp. 1 TL-2023]
MVEVIARAVLRSFGRHAVRLDRKPGVVQIPIPDSIPHAVTTKPESYHAMPETNDSKKEATRNVPCKHAWSRQTNVRQNLHHAPLRFASTAAAAAASAASAQDALSLLTRIKNLLLGTTIGFTLILGYYYVTDTRASIHEWLVIPCLRYVYPDAEDAHEFGNRALKALGRFGLHPRERGHLDAKGDLAIDVFGHMLDNPIGTSAGIDKHCDIPDQLLAAGPAVIEIGGATPLPQEGNPKPRVWRIPSQRALINRYGLNSEGADHVAMRLRQRVREYAYHMGLGIDEEAEQRILDGDAGVPPGSLQPGKLMAVQIAKNSWTADEDIEAVKRDYVYCVDTLARYVDILEVNVSSPNTPGLRGLQKTEPLTDILTAVVEAARKVNRRTPPKVMVKVSPDEDSEVDVRGICDAVWNSGVDGLVVGNTTKKRPDPIPNGYLPPAQEQRLLLEQGGYSGPQTFDRTVALVKRYRRMLDENSYTGIPERTNSFSSSSSSADTPSSSSNATQPSAASPSTDTATSPSLASTSNPPLARAERARKVIFATGGITNGAQALEVLAAGADVAQVYTALVYGGIGTISKIKREMRDELKRRKKQ